MLTVWRHLEPRKGQEPAQPLRSHSWGGGGEAGGWRPRSQAKRAQVGCGPMMLWLAPFHLMGFQEGFFKARA